jgi:hypothetical protein
MAAEMPAKYGFISAHPVRTVPGAGGTFGEPMPNVPQPQRGSQA